MRHGPTPSLLRAGGIYALAVVALCVVSSPLRAHRGIDEQIVSLTERIEQAPANAELYLRRGELHRIHRDWKLAQDDYQTARKLDPDLVQVDLRTGMMLLDAERYDAALEVLDAYVAKLPDDVMGRISRARARTAKRQWLDAVADYDHALQVSDKEHRTPTLYLERARALAAAGDEHLDTAVRGLDRGITDLDQPITLQVLAIELELRRNRYDAALARIDSLAARSTRQESWSLRRAEIYESAGRFDDARKAYAATLDAVEQLSPNRRQNRAVQRLADAATDGLKRLDGAMDDR